MSVLDLQDFLAQIAAGARAGDHFVIKDSFETHRDELVLDIEQCSSSKSHPTAFLFLKCAKPVAREVSFSSTFASAESLAEHMLLIPYREPWVEVYFAQRPRNSSELVEQLVALHSQVIGSWHTFGAFFDSKQKLIDRLNAGYGSVGSGPEPLMRRAHEILSAAECRPSSLPSVRPPWFSQEPIVLALGDAATVAATGFLANRVASVKQAEMKRSKFRGW